MMDKQNRAVVSSGNCPACDKKANFIFLSELKSQYVAPIKVVEIAISPSPSSWRSSIEFTDNVPEPLRRAYDSTVDAFNSKNYVATAVCCRRTLEGIFKHLVSDEKKALPLFKMIKEVEETIDLAAPLSRLSHAIRAGGNLGAHFDENLEPSEPLATHMVELVEYLLTYLYVLPERINGLDDVLGEKY